MYVQVDNIVFGVWTQKETFKLPDLASITLDMNNCDTVFSHTDGEQATVKYEVSNPKFFVENTFDDDGNIASISLTLPENRNSYQCSVEFKLPKSYQFK